MIPWLVCDVQVVVAMVTRSVISSSEQKYTEMKRKWERNKNTPITGAMFSSWTHE